jgi:16S rRNA (guanine966-N2)-methyltransferase
LKPGEVRIIGGDWKRSKLPLPRNVDLRPTPDRVRETLFNWLGQDLTGWHCVDAFAGTGALGFEAASRGAAHVLLCDANAVCIEAIAKNQVKLGATQLCLVRGDGLSTLRQQAPHSMDLVFLDPPYDFPQYPMALSAAAACIKPSGQIYLEAAKAWRDDDVQTWGLHVVKHLKAGAVHAHLLQPTA